MYKIILLSISTIYTHYYFLGTVLHWNLIIFVLGVVVVALPKHNQYNTIVRNMVESIEKKMKF